MQRRWLPFLLLSLSLLLFASFGIEILLRTIGEAPLSGSYIAGVSTSLPFALVLLAGGYLLTRDAISREYYPHIALGTFAGLAFFVVFFTVIAVALFETWMARAGVVRWAVAVGAGNGFLISYLYVRGVGQEVELERTSIRAEEADRQQRLLTYLNALLRHEVLNAATAINAHAELAEQAAETEEVHDRIAVIERQTDGMTGVIDDVQLLLAAMEDRDDTRAVNLTPLLREELQKLEDKCPTVRSEGQFEEALYVRGDDLLRRLFSNLFDNAIEHNEGQTAEVTVTATRTAETVEVAVADNGPGFPTDSIDDLFDPLDRMDTSHGLGLAIVTQLAERYGGNVELTETGDDGSIVTVTLPQANSRPEESAVTEVSNPIQPIDS
jgi:signal transduction histidine kinase